MIICAFENPPSIPSFLVTKIVYIGYGHSVFLVESASAFLITRVLTSVFLVESAFLIIRVLTSVFLVESAFLITRVLTSVFLVESALY